ncbi:MAG TPA: hypothetical protein VN345_20555, partial [Blastocatellia bacterium]|nr:hypothetical protein [Blastocatellia bacterium]
TSAPIGSTAGRAYDNAHQRAYVSSHYGKEAMMTKRSLQVAPCPFMARPGRSDGRGRCPITEVKRTRFAQFEVFAS